jgi:hypothetical protein
MNNDFDHAALAYARLDLWITQQLELLVNRWISLAAPCDAQRPHGDTDDSCRTRATREWRQQQERD